MLQDFRYAFRTLRRTPVITAVAIGSIALGIGANTAIFTLVDQVLLRHLPVKDPGQLVLLTSRGAHYGSSRGSNTLSHPMYVDFRDHNQVFSGMFARFGTAFNVGHAGATERAAGELVSGTYFEVLGVGAAAGRTLTPDDDRTPGAHPVAVLSHDYWRTRFASDPAIVGQTVIVNNHPMTVVGVSEEGFQGTDVAYAAQIRVPTMMKAQMTPQWDELTDRRSRWVNVFGRLRPGVTIEQAQASLQPFYRGMLEMEVREAAFRTATQYAREEFLKSTIDVLPASHGQSNLRRSLTRPLWVLMGTVGLVLLIACANVASLLIARAAARQQEIALRLALGASRGRLVRQLLVESLLLFGLGAAGGLALAMWTGRLLIRFVPVDDSPHMLSAAPDLRVLAFTLAVGLATGLVFGLVPALQATKPALSPALKDQGTTTGGASHVRGRRTLVVVQVTLSLVLLVGAGLFVRTLQNLRAVDLGIRSDRVVAFTIDAPLAGYSSDRAKLFYQQVVQRVNAVPGVARAGYNGIPLLHGDWWSSSMTVEGYQSRPGEDMGPYCNVVSPGYFKALDMPIIAGRDFDERDMLLEPDTPRSLSDPPSFRVAIVNQKFSKYFFGDESPIGRRIGFGSDVGEATPIEIVGLVGDAKYTGVRDEIPRQVFFPYLESNYVGGMTTYVRTSGDADAVVGAVRRAVQELDANVPIYNVRTLDRQVDLSLQTERIVAGLSIGFGVLATLLSVVGLYGVMAYMVARRTQEIGIRVALGAATGDVVWLVMRDVVVLVASGVALGLVAAWGLGRFVASQLYGVAPRDPLTLVAAVATLALVGAAAGWAPARRAARLDPVRALRCE